MPAMREERSEGAGRIIRTEEVGDRCRYWVCPAKDVGPGDRLVLMLDGREVTLMNQAGKYYAFRNRCPHRAGPLSEGTVLDLVVSDGPGDVRMEEGRSMLTCPWHGWEFDLETGQSYCDPGRWRFRRYRVDFEGMAAGDQQADGYAPPGRVPGPYRVDKYPVSVEETRDQEYLVISIPRRSL